MKKHKKIGLFFGSFNPIHNGHLIIANYFAEFTDLDEVWFVVSPQNPFKSQKSLLKEYHRLNLVKIAIEDFPKFRAIDIEFKLPKPSYTIHTLTHLNDKYRNYNFVLIMGSDNLKNLHKWYNYEQILKNYEIYVYPRPNFDASEIKLKGKIKIFKAPLMEISASFIRKAIKEGKDVRYFMPYSVAKYVDEMNFYKK